MRAIALLQQLQRRVIQVPFELGTTPIATAYVHHSPAQSASQPTAVPILLLPVNYPNWVLSLVLINSVGFSGSFPVGQFLPHPLIELGANWLHFRKQAALTAALALPMIDPMLLDALRCSLLHQEMPGWKGAIASFTQSGGYANLRSRIAQVNHPTLILWGEADFP